MATGDRFMKFFNHLTGEQTLHHYKTDGSIEYWRRKADGTWIKLPHWWHPATFTYQPWRPRIQHSCGRPAVKP